MGKSNSIEQQQRENQAFNDYVEKMRRDLDEQLAKEQKALAGRIEAHYRNYRDDNSLIASTYQHLTTVDEWSLDSVNAAIARCKTAIFGGQLPDGATRDTPPPEASAAIKAMANLDLLIANAAFDAVSHIHIRDYHLTAPNRWRELDERGPNAVIVLAWCYSHQWTRNPGPDGNDGKLTMR